MKKNQEKIANYKLKDGFNGIWIPREICLNADLTPFEKNFLSTILTLSLDEDSSKARGCFENNGYLATIMNTTKGSLSKCISVLKANGWIQVSSELNENGENSRVIKVTDKYKFTNEKK